MSRFSAGGRPWRRVSALLRASSTEHVCYLCGRLIDLSLPSRHPLSFSVDHVIPRSWGGAKLNLGNLRAVHNRCNGWKGARPPANAVRMSKSW